MIQLLVDTAQLLVGQWDRERITRAIGNLVGNAIKYSPKGGDVVVRVWRDERLDGPWAVVEVQDHGIGIPTADLPQIFEYFHRGANAVGFIPGTGIGLATVKAIIEQHEGSIHALSQEGVGSTFSVRLPLSPPPAAMSGDSSPTDAAE